MWNIKSETVENILLACKNTYPDEFSALLGGDTKKKIIEEIVVVPTIYGDRHAIMRADLIPYDSKIIGTIHSHPTEFTIPSSADLNAFSKLGEIHLIVAYPYNFYSISAYDAKGKNIEFKIF